MGHTSHPRRRRRARFGEALLTDGFLLTVAQWRVRRQQGLTTPRGRRSAVASRRVIQVGLFKTDEGLHGGWNFCPCVPQRAIADKTVRTLTVGVSSTSLPGVADAGHSYRRRIAADPLLAHVVGDYLLQSDWMPSGKTRRLAPAALHALVYGLPFLLLRPPRVGLLTVVVSHFVIDRWRLARYVCWAGGLIGPPPYRSWRACHKRDSRPSASLCFRFRFS